MGIASWFRRRPIETRSSGTGYTSQLIGARQSYIAGVSGIGELTATTQGCVNLWEGGLGIAEVKGTDLLSRHAMAIAARSLALRGEAVFLIENRLIPAVDWEISTRRGVPRAYRLSLPEAGGNTTETVLAAEVLHYRVAPDPGAPWTGQAPLRRASLTAGLLQLIETALSEAYANAPLGSQVVPMPESVELDLEKAGRDFRGQRGRVILRESVTVGAAGGPAPAADWRPAGLTPDLAGMMPAQLLAASRAAISAAFGVLPCLLIEGAQGPAIREAQRHLATWCLQPIAEAMAEETSQKLGGPVAIDVVGATQAFDSGGSARALSGIVKAMADAKAAGLAPEEFALALKMLDWSQD